MKFPAQTRLKRTLDEKKKFKFLHVINRRGNEKKKILYNIGKLG